MANAKVSQLTYADLEALPDDHNRYELIDGELLVSASPDTVHQRALGALYRLLHAAAPEACEVFLAPFDWYVDERNVYQPDLLVARRADLTERSLPRPPVLAFEVLSPSSRSVDLVHKRAAYQRAGLEHYWVVDPQLPAVTVLERVRGRLVEATTAKGDETLTVDRPFPFTLVPAALTR
jgi:Uma2 family endonuclease